jgi:hypothetical protein
MNGCDALVCGAGISGLLLAAELSKHLAVVVLERSARSDCSTKFWLTSKKALESNPELKPFIDSEWGAMDFVASSGARFTAKGEYVLWNTRRLEAHLVETIIANGSRVVYDCRFYSYSYQSDYILASANDQVFRSSILIDCMGFSSPIVRSSGAVHILGYHHLYGKILKLRKTITPIAIDNVIMSDNPSFLEIFPRSDGYANVVLIAPAETTRSTQALERDFDFIVEKSHYSAILKRMPNEDELRGIVPVGVIKVASLNRILFFGEAGQIHPAASCTCLTRILLQYKSVARSIASKVRSGRLRARDLRSVVVRANPFSVKFHQNMFREQMRYTSGRGEAFIDLLDSLDQRSLNDFIFGEITPAHFLQLPNFIRLLRKGNFVWLRPLLRTIFT